MEQQQLTPEKILQTGMAFWPAKTLLSAVELGLFTELAQGPVEGVELARRLGLHERSWRDFFDTLVALGFLNRDNGQYSNTPETNLFLDKNKPSYVGGLMVMANARLYSTWGRLEDALRTGLPQNEAFQAGQATFESMYEDPAKARQFATAMTGVSMGTSHAIAAKFPWANYKTFVDIGTAQGGLPVILAQRHPHLSGIGVDLAPIRPIFEEYVQSFGLSDRLRFETVDIFQSPFPSGDVIVMGHMLHGWGVEDKRMMVEKAYAALPEGGAVIIFEALIDDERRRNAFGLMMSLNMLIETPNGFDYTGAQAKEWLSAAGFKEAYVEPLAGPDSMVVAFK